jgi:periplasmic divalent cation tolerance protein
MPEAIVVLCTVPSDFDAERLARELVERSLAACVQIGPGVASVYRWQGATEKSEERLLVIKSRRALFGVLEAAIKARHPYEVPEIIALDVSAGHAPYLDWLAASTA